MQTMDNIAGRFDRLATDAAPPESQEGKTSMSKTILIMHSCQVISIGIANTLARLPSCDVLILEPREGSSSLEALIRENVLLICDLAGIEWLRAGRSVENQFKVSGLLVLMVGSTTADRRAFCELGACGAKACIPIDCRAEELLEAVARLTSAGSNGVSSPLAVGGLTPSAKRRVKEYIEAHITQKIEIEALASLTGLSKSHFSRAFRQTFGLSPYRHILDLRVALAAQLIKSTEHSLVNVSLKAGFSDQSHLTRTFTKLLGDTPGNFRRRYR